MKRIRRSAAIVGFASATLLALSNPAQAAQGTWKVDIPRCKIYQEVKLMGNPKHDHMRWYTTGGSNGCEAWINDTAHGTTKGRKEITNNGSYYSDWYYDGPGYKMAVCGRNSSGQMECGPYN
ncbi:hypothetical protein AB0937_29450 [Streptomyces sp. NPDC047880]|uniref:hypothetical protein n=1 Tax=Streptomyces sp. NPDC047880 TaxID=3155626 RepID=UPI0034556663